MSPRSYFARPIQSCRHNRSFSGGHIEPIQPMDYGETRWPPLWLCAVMGAMLGIVLVMA